MGAIKGQMVRQVHNFKNTPAPKTLSISGTAALSSALGAHEVLIQTTADCFFLVGATPVATVAGGHFIPSGQAWAILVDPSHKLSAITSSATGSFYISVTE